MLLILPDGFELIQPTPFNISFSPGTISYTNLILTYRKGRALGNLMIWCAVWIEPSLILTLLTKSWSPHAFRQRVRRPWAEASPKRSLVGGRKLADPWNNLFNNGWPQQKFIFCLSDSLRLNDFVKRQLKMRVLEKKSLVRCNGHPLTSLLSNYNVNKQYITLQLHFLFRELSMET